MNFRAPFGLFVAQSCDSGLSCVRLHSFFLRHLVRRAVCQS